MVDQLVALGFGERIPLGDGKTGDGEGLADEVAELVFVIGDQ